jgi:hypothetical protein
MQSVPACWRLRRVSFCYFRDLIEEVENQQTGADYWSYQKLQMRRLESLWSLATQKPADAKIASARVPKKEETG